MDKKESELYDEQFDIEWELYSKLDHLIGASWDSNTLKAEIEELMKQLDKVKGELWNIQKEDCPHNE